LRRYEIPDGAENEFQAGSGGRVLRNKLGLTDSLEAEQRETELLSFAYLESFQWVDTSLQFTAKLICDMHYRWLGELYPSAGQYRKINMSKGGLLFCPAENLIAEMDRFEREILTVHTPCVGLNDASLDFEELALRTSIVHAELILVHPFREGNGRIGRWLADLMVLQNGLRSPAYELKDEAQRQQYYSALRKAFTGNITDLAGLFLAWIEDAQKSPREVPTAEP
jgi:cell filamentation protein